MIYIKSHRHSSLETHGPYHNLQHPFSFIYTVIEYTEGIPYNLSITNKNKVERSFISKSNVFKYYSKRTGPKRPNFFELFGRSNSPLQVVLLLLEPKRKQNRCCLTDVWLRALSYLAPARGPDARRAQGPLRTEVASLPFGDDWDHRHHLTVS